MLESAAGFFCIHDAFKQNVVGVRLGRSWLNQCLDLQALNSLIILFTIFKVFIGAPAMFLPWSSSRVDSPD